MKTDIHPGSYRQVIFKDISNGAMVLVGSTIATTETAKWTDGKEYPLTLVEISSASHPVYTGKDIMLDTAGRAEKFKARAAKKSASKK
jgi:large subunit ribosomal protein L31